MTFKIIDLSIYHEDNIVSSDLPPFWPKISYMEARTVRKKSTCQS